MVKCADCGYLTMRHRTEYSLLLEVYEDYRKHAVLRRPEFTNPPRCFMRVRNFESEFQQVTAADGPAQQQAEIAILQKEIPCAEFTHWQQGFTPKEHRDIRDRQQALIQGNEIRNLIWQREDARDKRAENWQRAEMETLRNQHRWQLIVFGGLIGVATIAAGILDGLVSRGVDLLPF